jgi:hypothetical protein
MGYKKMKKKEKKEVKRIPYLDYACKVGERVQWLNIVGKKFEGVLKAWDGNVATLLLDDGTEMLIDC